MDDPIHEAFDADAIRTLQLMPLDKRAREVINSQRDDFDPGWPLPIDEVEGELWFEVDRYVEARDAYERAVKGAASPNALVGLARAADKLGDRVAACSAYTRARGVPGLPAAAELEIAMYLLKCQF